MKLRHNKKRNTAFLYEVLVKQYTIASINKNKELMSEIKNTIVTFFAKGRPLYGELSLYKTLAETNGVDSYTAKRLLEEAQADHKKLDHRTIFNEQTKVINWINKNVGRDAFSMFVPNYKSLATISQFFGDTSGPKERVLLEKRVYVQLVGKPQVIAETKMEPMDNLVYKTVIKNFNEKYDDALTENQKHLIQHFVHSFQDQGIGFVSYVGQELDRIKAIVEGFDGDEGMKNKMGQVTEMINTFRNRPIDKEMLEKVLKLQTLAEEIQNGDHD
jgi:hypothetical protein